ncbi:hypothetical protein PVNG_06317 [Plasmodium vivax North Korean]|uniref:Uncharacterized protein n=1 Tax=Plasmodium vivax North Korean TaxID=1035514 RepID=A0A0J9TM55_PLAVI|nr:hypothetical protein PVNG_06317 [Plasmodium vivax North Korean]
MSKSESENTFDPDKFIKGDPVLKTSKLFNFYQSLDDQKETNNNIPPLVGNAKEKQLDEQEKHLDELEKHLKNIFSNWDSICNYTDSGNSKFSEYLKYWLYGKIAEKKLNFFQIRKLNDNLKDLIKEKLSIDNENDCTKNFIKCAPIEVLHNKKILYDFSEYYIYLNNELSKIEENEKGEYCKYITHIFELYHKLYEEDSQWDLLHRYEDELSLFRTIFKKENALSSLKSKCNIDNSLIESFKDVKTTEMLEENLLRRRAISNSYNNRFINIKSEYENIIKELTSSKIYDELSKDLSDREYKSKHCDNLNVVKKEMKDVCKKMAKNIKTLPNNSEMKGLSHKDRCTYLNFWIYDELSKIYDHKEENIFDVPEVAKFLDADIKINKELIENDLNTNYNIIVPPPPPRKNTTEDDSQNSDTTGVVQISRETQTPPETEANKGDQVFKERQIAETPAVNDRRESTVSNQETQEPGNNLGSQGSGDEPKNKLPSDIINYRAYSNYNPCFFNYNCKFSECREMKHLYEYFKDYETIKKNINCDQRKNDKYYKYLTYISSLYNKHKDEEGCCSWGTKMCPYYFLQCDEAYDPRNLIRAIVSGNPTECSRIKKSAGVIKTPVAQSKEDKLRNAMYIKYMTCSYIPGSRFNKKGLICQQQSQRPHINNKFLSRYTSYNPPINMSTPISKNITVNGNTMNVVLISNPKASITEEDVNQSKVVDLDKSTSGYYSTLFPEVTGKARTYYLEEAEKACPKGQPLEKMSEYCRKSKRYNKIINLSNSQSANITLKKDIENWEDIVIPDDTSFLNEILQQLPVRMGAVIKLSVKNYYFIKYLFLYRLIIHLKNEYSNSMTLFCFPCISYYIINIKELSKIKIVHCKNIDIHVTVLLQIFKSHFFEEQVDKKYI